MKKQTTVIEDELYHGSGNVFEDLELPDAADHDLKAQIAVQLNAAIAARRTSQAQIARLLGIKQPHVSHIRNYKLQGFSIERLMMFLVKLGHPLRIVVSSRAMHDADIAVVTTDGPLVGGAAGDPEAFPIRWHAFGQGGKQGLTDLRPLQVREPTMHREDVAIRHVTFARAAGNAR